MKYKIYQPIYSSKNELFGLGQFLKLSSEEISKIEDILHCGRDSILDEVLKNEKKHKIITLMREALIILSSPKVSKTIDPV